MPSYGPAGRSRGLALSIIALAGVALIVVAMLPLRNAAGNAAGAAAWGIMLGGAAVTIVAMLIVYTTMSRAAAQRHAAVLETENFEAVLSPTPEQTESIMQTLSPLLLLGSSGSMLHWYAHRATGTWSALAAQHAEVIGTGDTAEEILRTVVAWPLYSEQPEVRMGSARAVGRASMKNHSGCGIGDAVFEKRFFIHCPDDPSAPQRLLTPAIKQLILDGPKRESWVMAGGYACCVFYGDVKPEGLRVMLTRARSVAEAWGKCQQ